ncbi:MAG TPA: hypothetical protein PLO51_04260, partial [Candidatus Micrarchaeota archaeon]|nr:hypothetical protein [Candidatus Micrarchaeota archaeon]
RKQCDDSTSVRCYDGDNAWRDYSAVYVYKVTINNFGTCDTDSGKLRVHTLGVCEACTTATITQQDVVARGPKPSSTSTSGEYCPVAVSSDNYPVDSALWRFGTDLQGSNLQRAQPICTMHEWDACGGHSERGKSCDCSGADAGKYGCEINRGWPYVTPVPQYLRDKLDIYLRSNVLPVLNMQDKNLWYNPSNFSLSSNGFFTTFTRNYDYSRLTADLFAKKDIPEDMGAIIVNVGIPNGNSGSSGNYASNADIIKRAKGVKSYCPKCLVAVENPDRSISRLDSLFGYDTVTKKTYNESAALVDMVLNTFNPTDLTNANPALCGDYASILNVQENYSRTLLNRYQKPSIVNRFDINESAIPDNVAGVTNAVTVTSGSGWNYPPQSGDVSIGSARIGTYSSSQDPFNPQSCTYDYKGKGFFNFYFDSSLGTLNSVSLANQDSNDGSAIQLPGSQSSNNWYYCHWGSCGDGTPNPSNCYYGSTGPALDGSGNYRYLWFNFRDQGDSGSGGGNGGGLSVQLYVNYTPSVSDQCW